jgi:hypothetical protein
VSILDVLAGLAADRDLTPHPALVAAQKPSVAAFMMAAKTLAPPAPFFAPSVPAGSV